MRLYLAIAAKAFQRRLAYRAANIAGLFTNTIFGFLRTAVFVALFQNQRIVGSYDVAEIITYSWVLQAMLMVAQLWGWYDVEETIRTGDVVSDLSKPFSYLGYWLAQDVGRAAFFIVYRGLPILAIGQLTTGLLWPSSPLAWLAVALSLSMAVVVSFTWRFMLNMTAFWTTDARGICILGTGVITTVSGFLVPIHFFPEPLRSIALLLPFAGTSQTPIDVWLGRLSGPELIGALGLQAFWCVAMLALCQLIVLAATRRLVVQGG